MEELAKSAIERFEVLLRTLLPGCVFMVCLVVFDFPSQWKAVLCKGDEVLWIQWLTGAALVGVLLYAVHFAVLESLWMIVVILTLRLVSIVGTWGFGGDVRKLPTLAFSCWLSRERWVRPVASDARARALQAVLSKQYSWLIFLYCTAYSLMIAWALLWLWHASPAWPVLCFGATVCVVAFLCDLQVTAREIWLNKAFPQFVGGSAPEVPAPPLPPPPA